MAVSTLKYHVGNRIFYDPKGVVSHEIREFCR